MKVHSWRFFRSGGMDQVQLTTGADLMALDQLDQKLWLALACPVKGIEFDQRTLELIDEDKDGRVRARELIQAIHWAGAMFNDVEQLAVGEDHLPLTAIGEDKEENSLLLKTARAMLAALGKADAKTISVADSMEATAAFNKQPWNGDGIVPVAACEDADSAQVIADILSCTAEPAMDQSGEPGVDAGAATAFFEAVAAYVGWLDAGQAEGVRPLGEDSDAAYAAFAAIRAKVDDFFARSRVAAYDARALETINREQTEYLEIAAKDLQISAAEIEQFPLSQVTGKAVLPLLEGLNPAWADAVDALVERVIKPIFGERSELSGAEWMQVRKAFAPYQGWLDAKAGASVEALGEARLRELLADGWQEKVTALIERDAAEADKAAAITSVERLVRYRRDLMCLANNFVAFRDFYSRKKPGIFQIGTLYIDQRACELCVDVTDAGRHASMALHSQSYLIYCDLKNAAGEKRSIAAALTDGDVDNLMVGRNGLFYDRQGNDWDATITKIVDNPVSVRQAFWSPYKKLLRIIEEQVTKRAQAAEAKSDEKLTKVAATADSAADGEVAAAAPAAAPKKLDIGVVAALGVAVGGITAALGMLLESFFGLGIWMPFGVLGIILVISGPSMAIAWLKLRQRNLGPLLDANGWTINATARVNVPLGRSLTQVAELPKGAQRDLVDPFAEKKKPWPVYAAIAVLFLAAIGWYIGQLDAYLPMKARSTVVLGESAPANFGKTIEAPEEPAEESAGDDAVAAVEE